MLLMTGFLTVLCGCWDIKDINHRTLPIVMGVEKKNDAYNVFLLIPENNQGGTGAKVVTGTGETINEVVDRFSKDMEVQVDLLHLKVIVFERAIAEQGLSDSISSFMRARDISPKTIVAISEEKLEPLFEKLKSSSKNGGVEIYNFFEKSAGWTPHVAQTRIWQIFRSLNSFTHDVAIPIIEPGRTTTIASTGSAVIKNGKMVGKITPDETLMFNAFNGLGTQGRIEVMDHGSVLIVADKLTHSSSIKGNKAILNCRLQLKVTILETKGSPSVTMIKRELDEMLTGQIQQMFRNIQSKEADILGMGQFFRTKLSRERLEHWRSEYYPYMKLNVQVNTIIQNKGLLKMKN
ncbi:Ger(x)C family spore germination protein [Cohnella nanjingensis]|uniref:Ger(X)C family spore germination protein n=1 Tax=Cohnella nanjingensis TaxID=1387779 RepID=A0A7X0VGT3_9BACL|nr:Ger(x)C family spore germination protein [Cohnella nanjingensis]MBB6673435.1 Ger(x)C family spore germination protein [Cohnella nanjingensis]